MWTVAACVGGRIVSGRRKTTRWFMLPGDGMENVNCVGVRVWRFVCTAVMLVHARSWDGEGELTGPASDYAAKHFGSVEVRILWRGLGALQALLVVMELVMW